MFGAVNLRWDANDGRVTSFLYKADMIKPIMRILGSLHDVSLLFHGALVTADCNIAVEGNPQLRTASYRVVELHLEIPPATRDPKERIRLLPGC